MKANNISEVKQIINLNISDNIKELILKEMFGPKNNKIEKVIYQPRAKRKLNYKTQRINRRWTMAEIKQLIDLFNSGKKTKKVAKIMGRTVESIYNKRWQLKSKYGRSKNEIN